MSSIPHDRLFLVALALATLLFFNHATPARAETVTGEMTADDYFMINVSYGPGQTTTVVPATGGWQSVETVSFEIDTRRLSNCTVQIVAWSTGGPWFLNFGGVIGHLTGNAGTMMTGSSAIGHYHTFVTPGMVQNAPSMAQFDAWIAASTGPAATVDPFWQQAFWGNPGFTTYPVGMEWIWSSVYPHTAHQEYRSFTFPCSAVVTDTPPPPPGPFDGDHFSCYKPIKLQAPSPEIELFIRDQFGDAESLIGDPVLHCNPSKKLHNGVEFGIANRERHLVCYEIIKQSEVFPPGVEIENQIGTSQYSFNQRREMFCVPSSKAEL
ncbi:MAG TPA: hypothetical protein ENK63_04615 [Rhodobacterales bacterium]|nr:hypothetical protein [Rhodobacterales bacterium]